MPALITHDMFARDVFDLDEERIGTSQDQRDAFLLGSQGPDTFFYSAAMPMMSSERDLGSILHREKPVDLLFALKKSLEILNEDDYPIGLAYAKGMICHYELDSNVHPLIYAQQFAICDAGVDGLTHEDENDVHAVIESDIDEMILFVKRGETVATYLPWIEILNGSGHVLDVVSKMYVYLALTVYGRIIPKDAYTRSVKASRQLRHLLYSPYSGKRLLFAGLEKLSRRHSLYSSMSHKAVAHETSPYDNRTHERWVNPSTGTTSTKSFWDLYTKAEDDAVELIDAFVKPSFSIEDARELTGGINFVGDHTYAVILSVEDPD